MLINIFGPSGSGKTTFIKELIRSKQLFKFYFYFIDRSAKKSLFKTLSTSLMPLPNFRGPVFDYFNLFGLTFDSKLENKYLEQLKKSTYNFSQEGNMGSRLFQTLSAGEQRRLVLFRALISRSDLVVIDEPFCNSDEKLKFNILQSIYHSNNAIILTHDRVASNIGEIENLKFISINEAKKLKENLKF